MRRLGLEPGRYILYVSRFEPENNPLMVRRARRTLRVGKGRGRRVRYCGPRPGTALAGLWGWTAHLQESR